jgi:hypothetical protein
MNDLATPAARSFGRRLVLVVLVALLLGAASLGAWFMDTAMGVMSHGGTRATASGPTIALGALALLVGLVEAVRAARARRFGCVAASLFACALGVLSLLLSRTLAAS